MGEFAKELSRLDCYVIKICRNLVGSSKVNTSSSTNTWIPKMQWGI